MGGWGWKTRCRCCWISLGACWELNGHGPALQRQNGNRESPPESELQSVLHCQSGPLEFYLKSFKFWFWFWFQQHPAIFDPQATTTVLVSSRFVYEPWKCTLTDTITVQVFCSYICMHGCIPANWVHATS